MKIAVITNDALKEELLVQGLANQAEISWLKEVRPVEGTEAYIDLLFNLSAERIDNLKSLAPATIIVNAVDLTLNDLPAGYIRINSWNSFLKRPVVEAAAADINKAAAELVFSCFNKTAEWVKDIPGFITPRVVSMIINEAYYGLEEKISTKEEIDTAMKLGTNYPYGPFEWGAIIGLQKVEELLAKLSNENSRYLPSAQLQKEARAK